MHTEDDIDKLAADFEQCQKILLALGDENRQHMILEMMKNARKHNSDCEPAFKTI